MEQTEQQPIDYEYLFKRELYNIYEKSNQHLLPKKTHSQSCDDLKRADKQKTKSSSVYRVWRWPTY